MSEPDSKKYSITLAELVDSARVPPEAQTPAVVKSAAQSRNGTVGADSVPYAVYLAEHDGAMWAAGGAGGDGDGGDGGGGGD